MTQAQPSPARATRTAVTPTGVNVTALREQRRELISQLEEVTDRRGDLAQERMNAQARGDQALVKEYDAQVSMLGERMARLERQKLQLDDAISAAIAEGSNVVTIGGARGEVAVVTGPTPAPAPVSFPGFGFASSRSTAAETSRVLVNQFAPILITQTLAILLMTFFIWRMSRRKLSPAATDTTAVTQLQQSVDAIAIEVERISENQRYVTKVLNDRSLGEGQQPVEVGQRGKVAEPRRV